MKPSNSTTEFKRPVCLHFEGAQVKWSRALEKQVSLLFCVQNSYKHPLKGQQDTQSHTGRTRTRGTWEGQ